MTQHRTRRGFLAAGSAGAVVGALGAAAGIEPSRALLDLIADEKDAYEALGDMYVAADTLGKVFLPIDQAHTRWNDAMGACLDFPCATVADFRRWAAFATMRLERNEIDEKWILAALRVQADRPSVGEA